MRLDEILGRPAVRQSSATTEPHRSQQAHRGAAGRRLPRPRHPLAAHHPCGSSRGYFQQRRLRVGGRDRLGAPSRAPRRSSACRSRPKTRCASTSSSRAASAWPPSTGCRIGTEAVTEAASGSCSEVAKEFPRAMFFAGKLIFEQRAVVPAAAPQRDRLPDPAAPAVRRPARWCCRSGCWRPSRCRPPRREPRSRCRAFCAATPASPGILRADDSGKRMRPACAGRTGWGYSPGSTPPADRQTGTLLTGGGSQLGHLHADGSQVVVEAVLDGGDVPVALPPQPPAEHDHRHPDECPDDGEAEQGPANHGDQGHGLQRLVLIEQLLLAGKEDVWVARARGFQGSGDSAAWSRSRARRSG